MPQSSAVRDSQADPLRVQVIFNPTAGARRVGRYQAVVADLRALGCLVEERPTSCRGDAEMFARTLAKGETDRLVVAGGDGTINEVVNGLLHNEKGAQATPLALLPLGTANVLAAEIGLKARTTWQANYIAKGRPRPISLGEAGGTAFLLMAGAGFDAQVVASVDGNLKRRIGKGAYIYETLRQLWCYSFPRFLVTVDGDDYEAASVIVCNAHYYGGRFVLAPGADLETHELEVCLFERPGGWNALRYSAAMIFGQLQKLDDYRIIEGRRITISAIDGDQEASHPLQGDGDVLAQAPTEIRVLPDALNLVFPE
ncbi:diacylglycerol/lipid kinase family protein [Rhodovibrionaceae bacterium A322]